MASALSISLARGTPAEVATCAALKRLLDKHDLEPWIYSRELIVEEGALPHSHPVLTLSTEHSRDDHMLLAEFVHEQLHWFEDGRGADRDRAIQDSRDRYPIVPATLPDGAADEYSTRLHLFVCLWEHQALQQLIGAVAARGVVERLSGHHYRWVYRTILRDAEALDRIARSVSLVPRALEARAR